jgi:hypothetical protein
VDDIRDAYVAGSVVVLSSISEGFPYTLIEAMTCGRATVATDVGGVREATGDTGLVVPPRDPGSMAEACLRLLRDELIRHRLGAAARARSLEYFTVDHAVGSFRVIYADLVAPYDAALHMAPALPAPQSVHAQSVHAPEIHAWALHAPEVHAAEVHAQSLHAPAIHVPPVPDGSRHPQVTPDAPPDPLPGGFVDPLLAKPA